MSGILEALHLEQEISFRDLVSRSGANADSVALSRDLLVDRGILERVERREATGGRKRSQGIRQAFGAVRNAYNAEGLHELTSVHHLALEECVGYRRLFRILQRVTPLSELLALAAQLDREIAPKGLSCAANSALTKLRDRWEIHYPRGAKAREILAKAPLIVYGNHPSMLTPFLLASALEREDLRFVAYGYVAKLIPAMADHIFPVYPTFRRSIRQSLSSGLSHLLSLSLLYRLDRVPDPETARARNRTAVRHASDHVDSGGATVIFPNAGQETGPWFPGLGAISSAVHASSPEQQAYLVPIRIRHNSNARVYSAISRATRGRPKPKECADGPIRVEIANPMALSAFLSAHEHGSRNLSTCLQEEYARTAWPAST